MPQIHDRGGWPDDRPIDRTEHELADWELVVDAIQQSLVQAGVMTVDELRRRVEGMERWRYEKILVEKGVLTGAEIDRRVAELGA